MIMDKSVKNNLFPDSHDDDCCVENMVSIAHVNVQSLNNKSLHVSHFLHENNITVFCISEHWLSSDKLKLIQLNNYSLASFFCREVNVHGGVAIYVAKGVKIKSIELNCFSLEFHCEFCGVELQQLNMAIVAIYRSPSNGNLNIFLEKLEDLLCFLNKKYQKIVLIGDFNVHFETYSTGLSALTDLFDTFGLKRFIFVNTRFDPITDVGSCLDNIITNIEPEICSAGVLDICISDHNVQFIEIKAQNKWNNKFDIRSINSVKLHNFKVNLQLDNFENIAVNEKVNITVFSEYLINTLTYYVEKHFPLRSIVARTKKNHLNFFNDHLNEMRNTLSLLKSISKDSHSIIDINNYKNYCKVYRKCLNDTKKRAYNNLILNSDNRSRDTWKIINHERGRNSFCNPHSNISVNVFVNYFSTVAKVIINSLPVINATAKNFLQNLPRTRDSFFFLPTNPNEVVEVIDNMKSTNSFDIYNINSKIIKEIKVILSEPLSELYNMSFCQGIFPDIFKRTKLIPLFKGGDVNIADNYRPISIVPILGKVLEHLVKKRLTHFIEDKKLLNTRQFGFRKNRSTVQAVYKLVQDIIDGFENGHHVSTTLIDLSKAFDCISHDVLFTKLEHYGIRGVALKFFQSYLSNRYISVYYNNDVSPKALIEHGVPQGSVLGPLLFIIYINDLFDHMKFVNSVLFADDATFYHSNSNLNSLEIESERILPSVIEWLVPNQLKCNENKTNSMIFSTSNEVLDQKPIKLLGLHLDQSLKWNSHIEVLCGKLSTQTFLLRRLSACVTPDVMRVAYFSLFHTYLTYGTFLWGNSSLSNRVFLLQKRSVRIVAGAGFFDSCRPLFSSLGIMTVPAIYIYQSLLEIHKNCERYPTHSSVHTYHTRNANHLMGKRYRLKISEKNSLNLNFYNKLPLNIKNMPLTKFKHIINRILSSNPIYEINEYLNLPDDLFSGQQCCLVE